MNQRRRIYYSEAQKAHLERLRRSVSGLRKKILSGRLEVGRRGDGGAETWWGPTTSRLVELHAEKERVEASERLLVAERDVAWETYEVLAISGSWAKWYEFVR